MNDRDRLEQLRAMLVRLERSPVSAERDWMLGEVRARAVDVESGVKPAGMRALPGAEPQIPAAPEASRIEAPKTSRPAKPKRAPVSRRRAARDAWGVMRATPAAPAAWSSPTADGRPHAHESVVDLLEQGGVLSLDDQPVLADGATRPWSAGLRG